MTGRAVTPDQSTKGRNARKRGPMKPLILAILGLVALVGCWWAGQHGQDQVSVAFALIGGTLLSVGWLMWGDR